MKAILTTLVAFVSLVATAEITEFRNGMPFAKEGFGVRRNFYMSGRISAKASDIANVFQLNYIGSQKHTALRFYDSNENCTFGRFMVPQVIIGEKRYRLTFENTTPVINATLSLLTKRWAIWMPTSGFMASSSLMISTSMPPSLPCSPSTASMKPSY